MKILILIFLSSAVLHAEEWECSKSIGENPTSVNVISFLKKYEGRFLLGSCKVEIQVCNFKSKTDSTGTLGADLLVTDENGFQRYVPFFLMAENTRWSKQVAYLGERALVYRFKDKIEDHETGADENYDIEFVRKENSEELDYIEIGYTGENERTEKINKNWMACGSERERYLKESPLKHKIKSLWWWLKNPGKR